MNRGRSTKVRSRGLHCKLHRYVLRYSLAATPLTLFPGRTRFDRLYLIGTTSTLLSTDVLKTAITEAKSGKDVSRYEKAVRALAEVAPAEPEATLDSAWVQEIQRAVRAQTDRLEHELRGYKNNLIKESIRVCGDIHCWVDYWN